MICCSTLNRMSFTLPVEHQRDEPLLFGYPEHYSFDHPGWDRFDVPELHRVGYPEQDRFQQPE